MKREWEWTPENVPNEPNGPLWAIVERLEALVEIMDELEQVGDVIANHLSFGGQPVGEMETPLHPANWQCQKTKECSLFNGHQGACIRPHDNTVTVKSCPSIHQGDGRQCALLAGHDGVHTYPKVGRKSPPRTCQCMKPEFDDTLPVSSRKVCMKCGYLKEISHAD